MMDDDVWVVDDINAWMDDVRMTDDDG